MLRGLLSIVLVSIAAIYAYLMFMTNYWVLLTRITLTLAFSSVMISLAWIFSRVEKEKIKEVERLSREAEEIYKKCIEDK